MTTAPLPAGMTSATLNAVSCPSDGSCVAVGPGLIETLSAGTWTPTAAPRPAGATSGGNLDAVACVAASSCVAVGSFSDSKGHQQGLIDALSGGGWTSTVGPLPTSGAINPVVSLPAITCPASGSCVAVGSYLDSNGDQQGLMESLSGGTWTPTSPISPAPPSNPGVSLSAVACPATGSCVAVGSYHASGGSSAGMIEAQSGSGWTTTTAPLPAGATSGASLDSVACAGIGSCVSVGSYGPGLIETLSGGTWNPTEAQLPPGLIKPFVLHAVSCTDVSSCVAVSGYQGVGLIETLSGGSWTPTKAFPPSGARNAPGEQLVAVSCPAIGSCASVGHFPGYSASTGYAEGTAAVIDTLVGGTWTPTGVPPVRFSTTTTVGLCCRVGTVITADTQSRARSIFSTIVRVGQAATFEATVSPSPHLGSEKPAVSFTDNGVPVSGCQSLGIAIRHVSTACRVRFSSAGSHTIAATFLGSRIYAPSSGTFGLTVGLAKTTIGIVSSANPSTVGQQVTYTTTVQPHPDGGTVGFTDNGSTISGCESVPVNSGQSSCSVTYTATGTHAIVGVYSGDANYNGSTSPTWQQNVN